MLAKNIPLFNEVNALPIPMDIRRLDDGTGIDATLIGNNVKYHNSCRIKFNNTKLLRVQKRVKSQVPSTSLEESPKFFRGSMDLPESSTNTRVDNFQCSLCNKHSPMSDLREAMTMKLDQRLRDCAATLQDEQLLTNLSGDVIAQEFKYQPDCLAALYNRERAAMRQEGKSNIKDASLNDIALAELVSYIFETQRNSKESVVFRLADLVSLYQERLSQLGLKSLPVHTTRLKEKLFNKMPGLKAHTKGRDLLLILEKDIGPTIALACDYSDTIHMAKTAEILREDLQKHKSKFMGSFSADEIQSSIPSSLLHLVKMIEHGPDIKSQLENDRCKSNLTIAQLLMFNYHPNITKRTVQQRHSLERETPFCVYLGLLIYAKTRKKQLIDILFQYGLCISYNRVL
jgi:hypothetical protein